MEIVTCKICNESGHSSAKCDELYSSLYGKFGEGAQQGQGHSHEDDSVKVAILIKLVKTPSN